MRDHEPDSIQTTRASYEPDSNLLEVFGKSKFSPAALMTVSIEDFVLEDPMTFNPSTEEYEYVITTSEDLRGRRVTISTDEGGAYNDFIQ